MKRSLFLSLIVATAILSPAQARPVAKKLTPPKQAMGAMPAEVRALLPVGATSLYLGQLPMGAGAAPMLVHLWAAGRKASEGTPHQFEPSPFCVDVFSRTDQKWMRLSSTVYLGEDGPRDKADVSVRWLHPAKKQNLVLVIVSPAYIATRFTVITYAHGPENSGSVQEFYQGGVGGGKTVIDFGVDRRGTMTVLEKSWYESNPATTKVLAWNGRDYAFPFIPKK